jgi:hypothetical protein
MESMDIAVGDENAAVPELLMRKVFSHPQKLFQAKTQKERI